jgi:hypothetical protein
MMIEKYFTNSPEWNFLKERGWKMVPTSVIRGSGACSIYTKSILLKPWVYNSPSLRHRKYVVPHEIAHALHAEVMGYKCDELMKARKLDHRSAVEVVADAYVLNGTRMMTAWVRGSILWHNRVNYSYGWYDVKSPQAAAIVAKLKMAIKEHP